MGKLWTDEEVRPWVTPWREARVIKVVDGDTQDLLIDVGFDVRVAARVRLMGEGLVLTPTDPSDDTVDAWEKRGLEREAGLAATARAAELLEGAMRMGFSVRVYSKRGGARGKYGRWLACILVPVAGGWRSLGDTLVEEGHAEPFL